MDQVNRLVSDAESEKETRKRINFDLVQDIKELRDWKNKIEGERSVLRWIIGILCTVVGGLLLWMATKK